MDDHAHIRITPEAASTRTGQQLRWLLSCVVETLGRRLLELDVEAVDLVLRDVGRREVDDLAGQSVGDRWPSLSVTCPTSSVADVVGAVEEWVELGYVPTVHLNHGDIVLRLDRSRCSDDH